MGRLCCCSICTTKIIRDSMEEMEAIEKSATPAKRLRLKVKS
jgi:hypothetical protein